MTLMTDPEDADSVFVRRTTDAMLTAVRDFEALQRSLPKSECKGLPPRSAMLDPITAPPAQWDASSNGTDWHTSIDMRFLRDMNGPICGQHHQDYQGLEHVCIRLPGHTGRHLAVDFGVHYPTAVWA